MANRIQLMQSGWTAFTGVYAGVAFTNGVSDAEVTQAQENLIAAQMRTQIYLTTTPAGEAADVTQRVSSNPTRDKTSTGSAVSLGRSAIIDLTSKPVSAFPYVAVPGDLTKILEFTTGATARTVTLIPAATAGAGAIQFLAKVDAGAGSVTIKSGTTTIATLIAQDDLAGFRSNGTNWVAIDWRDWGGYYISGRFYAPFRHMAPTGSAAPSVKDTLYFTPIMIVEPVLVDQLGVFTQAVATGLGVKMALYASNPANPEKPDGGALLGETTEQALTTATGYAAALGAPVALRPGIYWACTKWGGAGALVNVSVINQTVAGVIGGANAGEVLGTANIGLKGRAAAATGHPIADAFPAIAPPTNAHVANTMPAVAFRKA
jgi:hypothetical protein